MEVLILLISLCTFCEGFWSSSVHPPTIVGENDVTISCEYADYEYDYFVPEMIIEVRQNNNREWLDLAMINNTGSYILDKDQNLVNFNIPSRSETCYRGWFYCRIEIVVSITLSSCTIDPNLYSVFRCKVSNGSKIFKSQEKSILSTKGPSPKEMSVPLIRSSRKIQRQGDVVQLQCTGEVESINGIPSQDIRWCKKNSGEYTEIFLQEPPLTDLISSSRDGCTNIQKSEVFYHIMQSDTYLEIMCESGYKTYSKYCGTGSANSTFLINTNITTEEEQWTVSPILIYDENGVIDQQHFNTHGIGRTFYLMCSASSFTSQVQAINWCVKKTDNANWTRVVTQEDEILSTTNKSGEIIMFSRITYHVTEYDKVLTFNCEISASYTSPCGSGSRFSSLTVRKNVPATIMPSKKERSDASVAVLTVLFFLLLISVVTIVIVTYKRGELIFFGLVFKIERSNSQFQTTEDVYPVASAAKASKGVHESQSSVRYIEEPIKKFKSDQRTDSKNERDFEDNTQGLYEEPECSLAVQRQSIYENEALKNEKLNEGETSIKGAESELCDYDELQINEEQQDYEDLNF